MLQHWCTKRKAIIEDLDDYCIDNYFSKVYCKECEHHIVTDKAKVPPKTDNPIVDRVHTKLDLQQEKGLTKYGEYVNPDSYTLSGWLTHLQQELLDGAIYIECALEKLKPIEAILEKLEEKKND